MAGWFKRLTSSWSTPNKRNDYWPMQSAFEWRSGQVRNALDLGERRRRRRAARKVHKAYKATSFYAREQEYKRRGRIERKNTRPIRRRGR